MIASPGALVNDLKGVEPDSGWRTSPLPDGDDSRILALPRNEASAPAIGAASLSVASIFENNERAQEALRP